MKKTEMCNYNLVKDDVESIYKIFKDLSKEKDNDVLMLGWFQYFILICIEALNFVGIKRNLKYKKAIENCRARIKPFEIEYEKIYIKMQELNLKKMKEFEGYVRKESKEILKSYITNYGTYKINNKIIGNTFLYESLYKKIIYDNSNISRDKTIEVSKEIGTNIGVLMNFFAIRKEYEGIKRNIRIRSEDYNVFEYNNKLFKKYIDTNDGLILLNSISIINFYTNIMCIMTTNKEFKYRLGYIVYDNTYNNILKMFDRLKNEELNNIIKKYECLKNRSFRNCMFHYDLSHSIDEREFKEEMYFGIISKYLNISEEEYIKLIDEYMSETSHVLEKSILK